MFLELYQSRDKSGKSNERRVTCSWADTRTRTLPVSAAHSDNSAHGIGSFQGLATLKDFLIQPMIILGFSPRVSASFNCTVMLRDSPGINAM
jgi:hypothetical protein